MVLMYVWILTLIAISETNGFFQMVEISMRQHKGRDERDDIKDLQKVLIKALPDEPVFELKTLGNDRVLLILKDENNIMWDKISRAVSKMGHTLEVTAVETCDRYAKNTFNVDITYTPVEQLQSVDRLVCYEDVFTGKGKNDKYVKDTFRGHFGFAKLMLKKGVKSVCYYVLGSLPVRMIYLTSISGAQYEMLSESVIDNKVWASVSRQYQKLQFE